MNVAFLFPGQGSQVPGMLHTLPDHPTISRTLDEVSETLKQNVLRLDEVKLPENLQCVFARKFRRKRPDSGSKAGLAPPPSWLSLRRSSRTSPVFTLSGRMKADYRNIVLDLRDLRLADRDAVRFLKDCEADGMKLENCPAYVREWMDREED